jgi:lipopolysaccharide biosynthesis glycosyltransferase
MNILLCTDNKYIQHCAVTIVSVLRNNKNVSIYIFSADINEESIQILNDIVKPYGALIEFIIIESSLFEDFPMSQEASDHISLATYFRLFVETKLPLNIEKIIYLDSDIIVRNSLFDLWNLDIEKYALGAVFQYNEWAIENQTFERLGYSSNNGYFNAGVLLINLEYWRKNNVSFRLLNFIKQNFNQIISHDQDTLNAVLYNEVLPLSCKWNLLPFFLEENLKKYTFPRSLNYEIEVQQYKNNPVVIHFVFKPKPWEFGCVHPWKSEYFKYLAFTPWKGWRPKFILKSYFIYYLLPIIFQKRRQVLEFIKQIKENAK